MGISIWQLLIILAIALVIFGGKKLMNLGGDLGGAIKSFKKAMKDEGEAKTPPPEAKKIPPKKSRIVEGEVTSRRKNKV